MPRFPSVDEYAETIRQNWKVFVIGAIGGIAATALLSSIYIADVNVRLGKAQDDANDQARSYSQVQMESESLRGQLRQANQDNLSTERTQITGERRQGGTRYERGDSYPTTGRDREPESGCVGEA